MTKKELHERFEERAQYLYKHCDNDEERDLLEWAVGHLAEALNIQVSLYGETVRRP